MLTFVYPHVDQQSRTVTVRFELDNPGHKLRPGMTATVTLLIPPDRVLMLQSVVGTLRVPSSEPEKDEEQNGTRSVPTTIEESGRVAAVPESAVIDTGSQTIVYRESLPNVFEGVLVKLGPKMTGPENVMYFPVVDGLALGDRVVTSGSFLVDAETRLNPAAGSIYFGGSGGNGTTSTGGTVTIARPSTPEHKDTVLHAALAKLAPADRALAEKQQFCPILKNSRLGSMGTPVKLMIEDQPVFVCCPGCKPKALADPQVTLKTVEELRAR
jgi:hypothetical protein